jgi:hypothetical protein
MFIAPADQIMLPLATFDASKASSARPTVRHHTIATTSRRSSRRFSKVGANLVRLVPGATHLPFEAAAR